VSGVYEAIGVPQDKLETHIAGLPFETRLTLLRQLEALRKDQKARKLEDCYPETGPLRRELYQKHLEVFRAGKKFRNRAFVAANRVGKSMGVGAYEVALHLTGNYPEWWEGRRFSHPVEVWACGKTGQTVRDIVQKELLGPPSEIGTGMIPGRCIKPEDVKKKPGGVPDAIETVLVEHVSGGKSNLTFKSYDQGRQSFEGTQKHIIWLDEECDSGILGECKIRTMSTEPGALGGLLLMTFTPLLGLSETILSFFPGGEFRYGGDKKTGTYVVGATWDDVPHLSAEEKELLWAGMEPHLREARTKGIPSIGSGAIYPVLEEKITVEPFDIPAHWPRGYAMDVGWNATAALWIALDRESDIAYVYSTYKAGQAEPPIHAAAIKSRGAWINGLIDPAARGRAQDDGKQLYKQYKDLGLKLQVANNAVEAGIYAVWERLSTGRLKVFSTERAFFEEYRIYRRDEKGKIVKMGDHIMDCLRYRIVSLLLGLTAKPVPKEDKKRMYHMDGHQNWASI
jgi:phage terminase large subunit-like protein